MSSGLGQAAPRAQTRRSRLLLWVVAAVGLLRLGEAFLPGAAGKTPAADVTSDVGLSSAIPLFPAESQTSVLRGWQGTLLASLAWTPGKASAAGGIDFGAAFLVALPMAAYLFYLALQINSGGTPGPPRPPQWK